MPREPEYQVHPPMHPIFADVSRRFPCLSTVRCVARARARVCVCVSVCLYAGDIQAGPPGVGWVAAWD